MLSNGSYCSLVSFDFTAYFLTLHLASIILPDKQSPQQYHSQEDNDYPTNKDYEDMTEEERTDSLVEEAMRAVADPNEGVSTTVFGVDLVDLARRRDNDSGLPSIFKKMIQYINMEGRHCLIKRHTSI